MAGIQGEGETAGSFFQASLYLNNTDVVGRCTFSGIQTCTSKPPSTSTDLSSVQKSLL